jgi:hypothetical protein
MVKDDKKDVDELCRVLRILGEASGMEIDWDKSCAHSFDKYTHNTNGWGV